MFSQFLAPRGRFGRLIIIERAFLKYRLVPIDDLQGSRVEERDVVRCDPDDGTVLVVEFFHSGRSSKRPTMIHKPPGCELWQDRTRDLA